MGTSLLNKTFDEPLRNGTSKNRSQSVQQSEHSEFMPKQLETESGEIEI
jgi:hypothetical protein